MFMVKLDCAFSKVWPWQPLLSPVEELVPGLHLSCLLYYTNIIKQKYSQTECMQLRESKHCTYRADVNKQAQKGNIEGEPKIGPEY